MSNKKCLNKNEYTVLAIVFLALLVGSLLDNIKFFDNFMNCEFSLKDFLILVVQSQASLATLGIALVSLLTSRFGYKIHGVELPYFIANKINLWLTQKNVIIGIIGFVILSVATIPLKRYGLVIAFCFCSCVLLIFEILQIFLVFKTKAELSTIIERYLLNNILYDHEFVERFLKVTNDYGADKWTVKDIIVYKEIALKIWRKILNLTNKNNKKNCQHISSDLFDNYCSCFAQSINGLLLANNKEAKHIAIDYLYDLYCEYNEEKRTNRISIYADVAGTLNREMPNIDVDLLMGKLSLLPVIIMRSSYNLENRDEAKL